MDQQKSTVLREYRTLAWELINGTNLTSIDSSVHIRLLAPLAAFRNQFILQGQIELQERAESLIYQLHLIPSSSPTHKSKTMIRPSMTTGNVAKHSVRSSTISDQSSVTSEVSSIQIEITPNERRQLNFIIDQILDGSEVNEINPSALQKLRTAMKERRILAISEGNFLTARQLLQQLNNLSRFDPPIQHLPNPKSGEYLHLLRALKNIKRKFSDAIHFLQEERSAAKIEAFASLEEEFANFEEEKQQLENSNCFKPTKKLTELRQMENRMKKMGRIPEANTAHDLAVKMEAHEKFEYLQRGMRIVQIKQNRLISMQKQKEFSFNSFWQNKMDKLRKQYEPQIEELKQTIKRLRTELEFTGEEIPHIEDNLPNDEEEEIDEQNDEGIYTYEYMTMTATDAFVDTEEMLPESESETLPPPKRNKQTRTTKPKQLVNTPKTEEKISQQQPGQEYETPISIDINKDPEKVPPTTIFAKETEILIPIPNAELRVTDTSQGLEPEPEQVIDPIPNTELQLTLPSDQSFTQTQLPQEPELLPEQTNASPAPEPDTQQELHEIEAKLELDSEHEYESDHQPEHEFKPESESEPELDFEAEAGHDIQHTLQSSPKEEKAEGIMVPIPEKPIISQFSPPPKENTCPQTETLLSEELENMDDDIGGDVGDDEDLMLTNEPSQLEGDSDFDLSLSETTSTLDRAIELALEEPIPVEEELSLLSEDDLGLQTDHPVGDEDLELLGSLESETGLTDVPKATDEELAEFLRSGAAPGETSDAYYFTSHQDNEDDELENLIEEEIVRQRSQAEIQLLSSSQSPSVEEEEQQPQPNYAVEEEDDVFVSSLTDEFSALSSGVIESDDLQITPKKRNVLVTDEEEIFQSTVSLQQDDFSEVTMNLISDVNESDFDSFPRTKEFQSDTNESAFSVSTAYDSGIQESCDLLADVEDGDFQQY